MITTSKPQSETDCGAFVSFYSIIRPAVADATMYFPGIVTEMMLTMCVFPRRILLEQQHRAEITPAGRGRKTHNANSDDAEKSSAQRHAAMSWAQRLKRVFDIDIKICPACGGAVRIIAAIEDPNVIEKILAQLDAKAVQSHIPMKPPCRAPPQMNPFD